MTNYTNIDYFIQNSFLNTPGLLRPSRFKLTWITPPNIGAVNITLLENNVYEVTTPGISIETSYLPINRINVGRRREETIKMSFYESQNLDIKRQIYEWISFMVDLRDDENNFIRHYCDDFYSKFKVSPITNAGQTPLSEVFVDAFPVSVSETVFDVGKDEEFGSVSVTFAYRYHTIEEN